MEPEAQPIRRQDFRHSRPQGSSLSEGIGDRVAPAAIWLSARYFRPQSLGVEIGVLFDAFGETAIYALAVLASLRCKRVVLTLEDVLRLNNKLSDWI